MPRLGIEAWAAFKQVPRRGLEIGGILLGRTEVVEDRIHLWVDGYRTVESEHRSGPSYLLSESDFERLHEDIESSGSQAIGLFRTHTRSQELALDAPDSELLGRCFGEAPALLLLLGPVAQKAVVFARVEGTLNCIFECPMVSSLAAIMSLRQNRAEAHADGPNDTEHRIAKAGPAPVLEPELPALHAGMAIPVLARPGSPPPPPLPESRPLTVSAAKWGWATRVAIALLAFAAIADGVSHSLRHPPPEQSFLRLTIQPAGSSLRVSWDPGAPALKGAGHVVLHVDDGDQPYDRSLTTAELKRGAATYQPRSSNVTFRLDVYPAESKTVGVIQFQSSAPQGVLPAASERPGEPPAAKPSSGKLSTDLFSSSELSTSNRQDDDDLPESADHESVNGTTSKKTSFTSHKPDLRGMSVAPLNPVVRKRLHLDEGAPGVVVTYVKPASSAYQAAVQEGDIIEEVDRHTVAGVSDFEQAMRSGASRAVLLSVDRDGAITYHAVP